MSGLKIDVTAIPTPGTGTPAGLKVDVTSLPVGFQGLQGIQGDKGDKGDQGEPGSGGSSLPLGHDSILIVYKDAATITVKAGGQAISEDGTVVYTISADTDVSLTANLAYGLSETENTKYRLRIGKNNSNTMELVFSPSESATPNQIGVASPLLFPRLLRGCFPNDASSNLIPFHWEGGWQFYDVAFPGDGTEKTKVLDETSATTSFFDVPCAAFVPSVVRQILIVIVTTSGAVHSVRKKDDSNTSVTIYLDTQRRPAIFTQVNNTGYIQWAKSSYTTTRIAVWAFSL